MNSVRLITLDPAHFHAALVQREMYPGVEPQVHVYGPLGPDLLAHVQRIADFNARLPDPTEWELEMHASGDFAERVWRERPGNVVVLAGRNAVKIEYLEAAIAAGMHVLADKPWIIARKNLPRLEAVLDEAERCGLIAYDIMTERHEITSILQRALVNDAEVFGEIEPGTAEYPGVFMESVHYLKKLVAGMPLRRPPAFFDIRQQGEGLADVGTHLVDLVMWILFPEQAIDYRQDVHLESAKRWPTLLTLEDFRAVTGADRFSDALADQVKGDRLDYYCNTQVSYRLRGVHVRLDVLWGLEAMPGAGDTHLAVFRGTRSRVEIRQAKDENYRPELYVVPVAGHEEAIRPSLARRVQSLQAQYAGVGIEDQGGRLRLTIPDRYRVGHEAHFAEVARRFLRYLQKEEPMPAWEKPNMLAKYFVTTGGVALAQRGTP